MTVTSTHSPENQVDDIREFYATCGAGLENVLAEELSSLCCTRVRIAGAGVRFYGSIETGYRVCLWSRVANRVLLPIYQGRAQDPDELYRLVRAIEWSSHLDSRGSLAVDFFTANSAITHSKYGALKVKDAIVDQFRENVAHRPDVDREAPDVRINVYLYRNKARIAIDLSGSSLHRRGYRTEGGVAPLKENLAAALLITSGWPDECAKGHPLVDPLCGSGTFLIEAAMLARKQAPGLHRRYFGFLGWKQHDESIWQTLVTEAENSIVATDVPIVGADRDTDALRACRTNIAASGLTDEIDVFQWNLDRGRPPVPNALANGLVITNPPYGERLATDEAFYDSLGASLSRSYAGWRCALFTAESAPHKSTKLPFSRQLKVRNGGIDCELQTAVIPSISAQPRSGNADTAIVASGISAIDTTALVNRLKKNQRSLNSWIRKNDIRAYRLYDADIPEFAVAIDVFHAEPTRLVVQEYRAPATVNLAMAQARLDALIAVLPETINVDSKHIHLKIREVKSGGSQYERTSTENASQGLVSEYGAVLEINFTDYLDVGLFLDHRPVRKYIQQNTSGKRFLNLFSYTAAATAAAVIGGAVSTVSVDTSKRYCHWARSNLDKNGANPDKHLIVRQDAMNWLENAQVSLREEDRYDMVLLDPPTFSNSTDMTHDWNVQRDHTVAIDACLKVLAPGGVLIFSTNYRRFKIAERWMDSSVCGVRVEDRSRWSIDRDFQRNQRIHQCWFFYK